MGKLNELLKIDPVDETKKIVGDLKNKVGKVLKKRGAIIGMSGGIDSSVVLALCVKAFGPDKVLGIMLPEKESNAESLTLAQNLSAALNTKFIVEDISEALEGIGCYRRRDEAIKRVYPEFTEGCKSKIILPENSLNSKKINLFHLVIYLLDGEEQKFRLTLKEYLEIVAASNFKQRIRMSMLYFHAEARNYAVIGTGNKNEYEQGFFVKYGDGGADLKPIAHLYKSQVFQLADYLGIPSEIRNRIPTTDTYSAEQTQEEFFFRLPFEILDKIWIGWENGISVNEIADELNYKPEQIQNVIQDILNKKRTTEYLRMHSL